MIPPGTSEKRAENPGYKRFGTPGVDYDPYGEEMAPNARIWKMYVDQTDKMDKEMVDSWNKTLDIILLFAALFSAISTAFVLESSKDLKEDPAVTSAQTLLLISQTLLAMSNGSVIKDPTITDSNSPEFTPERSAIIINVLWFTSLSLSVVVSLVAMLAKEWCEGFMSGRVGSMLKQGRMRQQRWDGIERWRMREILYMLPLLMHAALLLFAIGLSLYLWNVNIQVALPVIITSVLGVMFYITSVVVPLFSRFCPYTTTLSALTYTCLMVVLKHPSAKVALKNLAVLAHWALERLNCLKWWLLVRLNYRRWRASDIENARHHSSVAPGCHTFQTWQYVCLPIVDSWIRRIQSRSLTDRSQLLQAETPMDNITSAMLAWMITHCEDPNAVDIVSQALSGAEIRLLPREPLWTCGMIELTRQRLIFCLEALDGMSCGPEYDRLLENASLYSRTLTFLTSCIPQEFLVAGLFGLPDRTSFYMIGVSDGPDGMERLDTADGYSCVVRPFCILEHGLNPLSPQYDIVAFELNNFPLGLNSEQWDLLSRRRKQCSVQWKLLKGIVTNSVKLSPGAVLALVSGITKTFFYEPSQSPFLLLDLLNLSKPARFDGLGMPSQQYLRTTLKLRHAVGTAFAVFVFARTRLHTGMDGACNSSTEHLPQVEAIYRSLITDEPDDRATESLLLFGLLELLGRPGAEPDLKPTCGEIRSIRKGLQTLHFARDAVCVSVPAAFLGSIPEATLRSGAHWASIASAWLDVSFPEYVCTSESDSLATSCLDAVLCKEVRLVFGAELVPDLMKRFAESESPALKRFCLKVLQYAIQPGDRYHIGDLSVLHAFKKQLLGSQFLPQLLQFADPHHASRQDALYGLYFQWIAVTCATLEEDGQQDLVEMLSSVFKSPVIIGSDEILQNEHGLGLADLWRGTIEQACIDDPQSILDSGLMDEMAMFYGWYPDAKPYPTRPLDEEKTWLIILRELKEGCKQRIFGWTNGEDDQLPVQGLEQCK